MIPCDSQIDQDSLERDGATIMDSRHRLEDTVNDLFDVSRRYLTESGQTKAHLELVGLTRLIWKTIERHWQVRRHGRVIAQLQHGPPLLVDLRRIQQIAVNLVDNALTYSPGGGPVTIILGFNAEGAVPTVADQSIGLPPGSDQSIFEPFNWALDAAASPIPGMRL